jgi:Domain of unknown function (DUF4082)/Fibronectin type III domain/Bacterial Ig domain
MNRCMRTVALLMRRTMGGMAAARWRRRRLGIAVAVVLALATLAGVPQASGAATCANPVACENLLPGTPQSAWDVGNGEGKTIQGFADPFSVNLGGTVHFKIESPAKSYAIDIYRMGYYGGDGARLVASVTPNISVSQNQPACNTNTATGLVDCSNWGVSASWTVPTSLVSGVYFAHIYRTDGTSDENQIPFVVRNDASTSAILFGTDDETWQAYNDWGGYSLYTGDATDTLNRPTSLDPGRAEQVSYDRPFATRFDVPYGQDYFFYAEFPTIEFLEENGYNVSYIDQGTVGSPQGASQLEQHKVYLKAGHDEYWTAPEVANVTAARNAGVNLAFFTGNEVYWKTRWAPDATGEAGRTLITYKESLDSAITDPAGPSVWTGEWMDPRFSPPGDGGQPQNALTGQLWTVNAGTYAIQVPATYSKLRFWRNTGVANLQSGQTETLAPETLGYEWDQDVDNGFRPSGEFDMSSTTETPPQVMDDYQENLAALTVTHNLTEYRAASGALVFEAGTVQWVWGLSSDHDGDSKNPVNQDMQQATVNVLADMGAQPTTLMSTLAQATASTDTTPPASTITSPPAGTNFSDGASVTITGTATDSGGGVVAGVEISADGGTTWHPVTTMSAPNATVTWSYNWVAHGSPSARIETRATDDSGNIEAPSDTMTVYVGCPCSIWGPNVAPASTDVDSGDKSAIEVGFKFTSDVYGMVNGIRFYKASTNTGTHIGNLWTASGQLLASATFTNETASGWQQVNFAQPVLISPNTTYIASYFAPSGHYSQSEQYFYPPLAGGATLNAPPLHAEQSTNSNGDGLYVYTGSNAFPTQTFNGENYWVDLSFTPATVPTAPTNVTATAGYESARVSWTAPSAGVTSYTVTPYRGTTALTPVTVTGNPANTSATIGGLTNGTSYTFTVTAANPVGTSPASAASNAVTPSGSAPPAFAQQVSAHASGVSSLAVTPQAPLGTGDRIVVEASSWSGSAATTSAVTDSAGDTFTEVSHFTGSDKTEQSIWTAPVTSGAGVTATVTAKFTGSTDAAITMLEYTGLSTAAGSASVDQVATANGTTSTAGTVSSGVTAATGAGNELAIGFYSDSGFGDTLTAGSGWTARTNVSSTQDMEILAEDQVVGAGATPSATAGTGGRTTWEMATVVFKSGSSAAPSAPAAPANVTATAGNQSATVSWTAPANNGSPITSYTITPYIGSTGQTPTVITGTPPATSTVVTGLTNGTAYTFTVTATNGIGTGPASAASAAVTPVAPTAPTAPTGVTATAGNASATVSWSAPANGGSPITSYTITPYIGSTGQTPTVITGTPPATSTVVTGLTNGTAYTFTVTATNGVGTGPASAASAAVTPSTSSAAFVQQANTYTGSATSLSVTPTANLTTGNRLVVLAGIWGSGSPTASGVTDSAGDTFTEVLHFKGSDGTEMSVWTAPITAGGGTKPTIKVTSSAKGDIGIEALEYSGLSSAAGTGAIDQTATATGTTGSSSGTVTSAATPATTAANELVLGFYVDSGFGDTLSSGTGFTQRANVSPNGNMEFLTEDATAPIGATPAASAGTGAKTIWLMSTVVFKL